MFPVTVCEADSTTTTSNLQATIDYSSDHNDSSNWRDSSESDNYQHSEPEFVEDFNTESDAEYNENCHQGCNPKILTKTTYNNN